MKEGFVVEKTKRRHSSDKFLKKYLAFFFLLHAFEESLGVWKLYKIIVSVFEKHNKIIHINEWTIVLIDDPKKFVEFGNAYIFQAEKTFNLFELVRCDFDGLFFAFGVEKAHLRLFSEI